MTISNSVAGSTTASPQRKNIRVFVDGTKLFDGAELIHLAEYAKT
jgi:hypothetical protein